MTILASARKDVYYISRVVIQEVMVSCRVLLFEEIHDKGVKNYVNVSNRYCTNDCFHIIQFRTKNERTVYDRVLGKIL